MPEEYTYNLEEPTGKVRLMISDVGGDSGSDFIFKDEEISVFLNLWEGNLFYASAHALRVIAANNAMVLKKIKLLELETDGPATSAALEAAADKYEQMGDNQEEIQFIEMGSDFFARRAIRLEQWGEPTE